jgi:hypothetical protein
MVKDTECWADYAESEIYGFSWVGFLLIFTTSVEEYQTLKKEKNTKKKKKNT